MRLRATVRFARREFARPALVSRASAARPGTQGRHDGSRPANHIALRAYGAGSRVSFRFATFARDTRSAPDFVRARRRPFLVKRTHVAQAQHVGTGGANGSYSV